MSFNTTTWRTHPQTQDLNIFALIPDVVFARTVNMASISYPVTEITYDGTGTGAYTDVRVGQTVKIMDGSGNFKGWARVRETPTSSILKVNPLARGDIALADNDTFQVLDDYRIWAKEPYIDSDGEQFKDWNLTFSAGAAQPPVANGGAWYAREVDSGTGVITVTFPGSGSFAIADGASIASHLWDIADGSYSVGSSSSSTNPTATFPPGKRWVQHRVTDTNGNTHTEHILVVAIDPDTFPAQRVNAARLEGSIENGWEGSFQLLEADTSDYPEGAAVIVWAEEAYGSTAGSLSGPSGREHIKFCGYVVTDLTHVEPLRSEYTINAASPLGILARLPAFPQTVQRADSPASWFEVANLNWWRHVHYLMQWHTTALDVCNVERPDYYVDYPLIRIEADAGSVADQLHFAANAVAAKVTCGMRGEFYFRKYPHLMDSAARAALAVGVTLAETDWADAIDIEGEHRPAIGSLRGSGIVASATEVIAVMSAAPGSTPGQGGIQDTLDRQLVTGQTDLNERTGRAYALRNLNVKRVPLRIFNVGQVVDPASLEWVQFTLASDSNSRALAYSSQKFVLDRVSVDFDHENGASLETWGLEKTVADAVASGITVQMPGADAPVGEEYIASDGTYVNQPLQPYEFNLAKPFIPAALNAAVVRGVFALAWNNILTLTNDFAGTPDWTLIAGISGNVLSVIRLSSTRALVLTSSNVYDVSTITSTPTVTNRQAITAGKLLRYAEGVAGGIASGMYLATTSGGSTSNYTNGFTSGLGTAALTDASFPFGKWANGAGAWSASGGRTDAGCVITTATGVSGKDEATVYVDLGSEVTITAASMYHKAAASSKSWGWRIAGWNASKTLVSDLVNTFNAFSNTSYIGRSWSGSLSGVRYLSFTTDCNTADMDVYIDDIAITYTTATGGSVTVKYSDDAWVAVDSTQTVGDAVTGETGYDVDDYNKGIHLGAADGAIFSSTSYTGTFAQVTGLSVPSGSVKICCIRAIRKIIATQANNDDETAFQFIYGTDSAISGKTLFLVTYDRDTRVAATETDITPIIGGTTYVIVAGDGNQIESYGGNTQRMLGFFQPVGGGDTVLLGTVDGGATWAIKATFEGQWVRFVEPGLGGNGLRAYLGGGGGIRYTENFGNTLANKDGDFSTETGSGTATGAFKI